MVLMLLALLCISSQATTVLDKTVEDMSHSPPPLSTPPLVPPTADTPLDAAGMGDSLSDTNVVKAVLRAASGSHFELALYFRHVGKLPESVILRLIWLMENGQAPSQADAVADILKWQNSPAWRSYLLARLRAETLTPSLLSNLFEQVSRIA